MSRPPLRSWSQPMEAVRLFLAGATMSTCLPVAIVVGTVLSLVNQADVVLMSGIDVVVATKLLANYLIPFLTASTGALLAVRLRRPGAGPAGTSTSTGHTDRPC